MEATLYVDSNAMRRHWKLILGMALAVLLAITAAGYLWLTNLVDPMPETASAMVSDDSIGVDTDSWLTFTPAQPSTTGFIFYPGGRVPAQAYAAPVRALAEAGYTSIIAPMPFGLAVIDPNAADGVIAAHPEIERWVIGGHSLGGAMAAQYAAGHEAIDGLALWAAYPPGDTDLSQSGLLATSIYATEDGLTTSDEIDASRGQLPPDTAWVEVDGGNHGQFGWYGDQAGDGVATITREHQQDRVVAATLELLEAVSSR